jgi:2-aminoadipate transaminase
MPNNFASRLDGISGSAIREIFKLLANPQIISFAGGNPAPESFPKEKLAEISSRVLLENGERILQYGPTRGYGPLMDEVLDIAKKQGIKADLSNIIITSGSSQGIELMAKTFINKGDVILVESPTFIGAIQTFKTYEANLVAVKTDEEGILLDDLEAKIKKHSPKFLYAIPTFQNPSGVTLAEDRREKLVKICSENSVKILEDDPYGELRFSGEKVSPLKSFDKDDTVIRLVSFSKIISPGIRVGAAIGDNEVISKFELFKQGMDVHTTNLAQVMVYEYLKSGDLDGHIKEIIRSYSEKKALMLSLIKSEFPSGIKISPCDGGLFIWLTLPSGVDTLNIFKKAVKKNVAFVPGTHFFAQGGNNNTLRLNFSMVSKEKIEEGMKILGKVIKDNI